MEEGMLLKYVNDVLYHKTTWMHSNWECRFYLKDVCRNELIIFYTTRPQQCIVIESIGSILSDINMYDVSNRLIAWRYLQSADEDIGARSRYLGHEFEFYEI